MLVQEISGERNHIEVLIDPEESPHHFQFKPSHLKRLRGVDLMIWISDDFETGLQRIQTLLPDNTSRLQLVTRLPTSQLIGEGQDIDGHIWLSPPNLASIAELVATALGQLDPQQADSYQNNATRFKSRINEWEQSTRQGLQQAQPRYIVEHQFLGYLEKSLGIQAIGAIHDKHDRGSSIKRLKELYQRLDTQPARCLLVTNLPLTAASRQVSEQYKLDIKLVDTLGRLDRQPDIVVLLQRIADILESCS
jgi:ABC-type Zn uptake system ZnuABC Zn-binding protein ZnuA